MKKFLNKKTIPFILLFFIILYFHLFFTTGLKDDILYANFLKKYSYFEFLSYHYRLWSSRLIIETVLIVITNLNEVIWKILDSFLFIIVGTHDYNKKISDKELFAKEYSLVDKNNVFKYSFKQFIFSYLSWLSANLMVKYRQKVILKCMFLS